MIASASLSPDEKHIWRSLLGMSDLLRFRVAADVREVSDLSRSDHTVLFHLEETESGELPQQSLASSMYWSKSRVSHQLARMEVRGLVSRALDPETRQVVVSITELGRAEVKEVAAVHAAAVRRYLLNQATDELN